ncbi:hypothetical protein NQ315_000754 [Exocentrus adspersus]|uniref:Uncharacterized protein n=1 Tax=Exocentrus adspersus TaxID=1586481 RepID=A0AAV8WDH7_9CUCU|nr:hypothetical protein NQ315_000754 [Exocentrus adspersus]
MFTELYLKSSRSNVSRSCNNNKSTIKEQQRRVLQILFVRSVQRNQDRDKAAACEVNTDILEIKDFILLVFVLYPNDCGLLEEVVRRQEEGRRDMQLIVLRVESRGLCHFDRGTRCAAEKIFICPDSRAVLRAISSPRTRSILVQKCTGALKFESGRRIFWVWVFGKDVSLGNRNILRKQWCTVKLLVQAEVPAILMVAQDVQLKRSSSALVAGQFSGRLALQEQDQSLFRSAQVP